MRFLRNINAVLVRELKRIWAFPSYMMLLTVLPVISFAFFAVVFENGIPHDLPIAVLDEDHSSLSRTLTQMIDAAPETAVRYGVTDMDEVRSSYARERYMPWCSFRRSSRRVY